MMHATVKQHLGTPGNFVSITVRDTGFGMDKETMLLIDDKFTFRDTDQEEIK